MPSATQTAPVVRSSVTPADGPSTNSTVLSVAGTPPSVSFASTLAIAARTPPAGTGPAAASSAARSSRWVGATAAAGSAARFVGLSTRIGSVNNSPVVVSISAMELPLGIATNTVLPSGAVARLPALYTAPGTLPEAPRLRHATVAEVGLTIASQSLGRNPAP